MCTIQYSNPSSKTSYQTYFNTQLIDKFYDGYKCVYVSPRSLFTTRNFPSSIQNIKELIKVHIFLQLFYY